MAYCTVEELKNLTGAEDLAATLIGVIAQADREIDALCALAGITASGEAIHGASLNLSIAGVMSLHRTNGQMPGSVNVGGVLSMSDNLDAAIAGYRSTARSLINAYISSQSVTQTRYISKVNG